MTTTADDLRPAPQTAEVVSRAHTVWSHAYFMRLDMATKVLGRMSIKEREDVVLACDVLSAAALATLPVTIPVGAELTRIGGRL